jgi:hypothetical protein
MTDTPKHTKITSYNVNDDGSLEVVVESYFDELASRKQDIISKVKTDYNNFYADLVSCTDVIKNQQTKELHLVITVDEWNKPALITKQYTVRKENYNRR